MPGGRFHEKEWPKIIARIEAEHGPLTTAIQQLYHGDQRSMKELREVLRVGPATLDRLFVCAGVAKRTHSEGVALQYTKRPERRAMAAAVARNHLVGSTPSRKGLTKETCPAIAKAMTTRLLRYGHTQPYNRGSKHGNWCGGSDKKWIKSAEYREARAQALQRDAFQCTACGKTMMEQQWETGQPLSVHHIMPYRAGGTHAVGNLRTLCFSCHGKIERESGIFQYVDVACGRRPKVA